MLFFFKKILLSINISFFLKKFRFIIYLTKFKNTFLYPRSSTFFKFLIKDFEYNYYLNNVNISLLKKYYILIKKIFSFFFWFFPTIEISNTKQWIIGDLDKNKSPLCFLKFRKKDKILLKIINNFSKRIPNVKILDFCCNNGRFLRGLNIKHALKIDGVDIMKSAVILSKKINNRNINIYHDFGQRFLLKSRDNKWDIVFSVGATIELIHPSFDVIKELCRITSNYLILLISENDHAYPRFYCYEIENQNFSIIEYKKKFNDTQALIVAKKRN